MEYEEEFTISPRTYDWFLRLFRMLESRIGLNIKIHNNDDDTLNKGQIFLFNHFARFETVIPNYVIYRETGAYCRTITDAHLFKISESFSNFMASGGAVPNDMPGLLPFLAAEILRGRKVVIFPEGGMIKDRRVMDDDGRFGVFSLKKKTFRKHHRGAAVLALTLEIFKRRIKDVFEEGNEARINHWCTALGMNSREALLEQVNKPTLVVPSTITFNPIRIDDNILSRAVERLGGSGVPDQLIEEMSIEGNLLLKDTDMDIRLSEPISAGHNWSWWERFLLGRYFQKVDSLADLFNMRSDSASSWVEKLLTESFETETGRMRDAYMKSIYEGITVNLAHLASELILSLLDRGIRQIDNKTFFTCLYVAMKELQNVPEVYLHRSMIQTDRYKGLLDGTNDELNSYLETCTKAGLITQNNEGLVFLAKLEEEHHIHAIRLENPVMVNANEVGPIKAVGAAVNRALDKCESLPSEERAALLFDDEIRAHAWNRTHFNHKRYLGVNEKETATRSGQPYLHIPKKRHKKGVLLIHGFLSSPSELSKYGEHLKEEGHVVMGVRLAGHGTSPWDLQARTWEEWLDSVRAGYRILSAYCDEVCIVGFSAGGILGLLLAAEAPEKVTQVVSVCAPLAFENKKMAIVPLMNQLNKLVSWIPMMEGAVPFYDSNTTQPDINYQSMPVSAVNELKSMVSYAKKHIKNVKQPTLIIQADEDPIVSPHSADDIYAMLNTQQKKLYWVKSKKHGIIQGNIGETWDTITRFVQSSALDEKGDDAA